MFIQDENNELLKQQINKHKHYYIVIKKNNLKFYLSFSDNSLIRRRQRSFDSLYDMESSDFKLDFKFGYREKNYENLQQFHDDFKEVRTDLIPSKDLLNVYQPGYSLRWKLEDEDSDDEEIVVSEVKSINKLQYLTEHKKKIICIDYDMKSKKMATGSLDKMIYVYDLRDAYCIGALEGHKGGIRCLQLMKSRLCSGSWDATIIIWNLRTFCQVTSLTLHSDTVSSLYFDDEYLISGSYDRSINVWRFKDTYKESWEKEGLQCHFTVVKHNKRIDHHRAIITCLTYDGIKTILSSDADGLILLSDINSGSLIRKLVFSRKPELVTRIKLVGALILATTAKGKVIFWNRKTNSVESIIKCTDNQSPINSIAFYDNKFYTADNQFLVKEWDLPTLTCLRRFEAHNGPVLDLIVLDTKIISCGADKTIIWNLKENFKS